MNERDIELRQQAWDYFEMHGNQRLTTFNFYIVISSVVATALFTVLTSPAPRIGWLPGGLLVFFSFVFWKLDSRNAELIKGAEAALKYFEQNSGLQDADAGPEPHAAKIFLREEFRTNARKRNKSLLFWRNHLSFSDCFRIIFVSFGLTGLVGIVLSLV